MQPSTPARARQRQSLLPRDLSPRERGLLRLHVLSSVLTGMATGSLNLTDATLVKTLGATPLEVTALSLLMGLSFLAALFWSSAMRGRRKAPFILGFAVLGRLGLWLLGAWQDPRWFIAVIGLAWISQALIGTAQVTIIQRAYRPAHRDALFGLTISATTSAQLVTAVALGWLLDWNEAAYGLYYGLAGTVGFLGAVLLARMEARSEVARRGPSPANGGWTASAGQITPGDPGGYAYRPFGPPGIAATLRSVRQSVRLVLCILRQDAAYRRFQRNFFLYGIAFLCLTPVVPLFLVHDLALDYRQIGLAKGLLGQAGMILLPPVMGRWMERLRPARFCGRVFALLTLYPLLLIAAGLAGTAGRVPLAFAAFGCFGIGMGGISVAWNMSSIHYAGEEDPSTYQAVHTFLTGLRGSFAPLLGYFLMQTGTKLAAFGFAAGLLLTAALLMRLLARPRAPGASEGGGGSIPAGGGRPATSPGTSKRD